MTTAAARQALRWSDSYRGPDRPQALPKDFLGRAAEVDPHLSRQKHGLRDQAVGPTGGVTFPSWGGAQHGWGGSGRTGPSNEVKPMRSKAASARMIGHQKVTVTRILCTPRQLLIFKTHISMSHSGRINPTFHVEQTFGIGRTRWLYTDRRASAGRHVSPARHRPLIVFDSTVVCTRCHELPPPYPLETYAAGNVCGGAAGDGLSDTSGWPASPPPRAATVVSCSPSPVGCPMTDGRIASPPLLSAPGAVVV